MAPVEAGYEIAELPPFPTAIVAVVVAVAVIAAVAVLLFYTKKHRR